MIITRKLRLLTFELWNPTLITEMLAWKMAFIVQYITVNSKSLVKKKGERQSNDLVIANYLTLKITAPKF